MTELQGQSFFVIANRKGFSYAQKDPEDNILSTKIVSDAVKSRHELYKSTQDGAMKFNEDIKISKWLANSEVTLTQDGAIADPETVEGLSKHATVTLLRPHEFCASLAKLLCLGDELFETSVSCDAVLNPQGMEHFSTSKSESQDTFVA